MHLVHLVHLVIQVYLAIPACLVRLRPLHVHLVACRINAMHLAIQERLAVPTATVWHVFVIFICVLCVSRNGIVRMNAKKIIGLHTERGAWPTVCDVFHDFFSPRV